MNVSVSSFVPKPFTPFQWSPQDSIKMLREKQSKLRDVIRANRQVQFSWHESNTSYVEAVFARGDRKIADVLELAWKKGAKFDGWDEHFKFDIWMESFKELGIDPDFYAARERGLDEVFPWDHIDVGVKKEYLITEYNNAKNGVLTTDCRETCTGCGVSELRGGECEMNFDAEKGGHICRQ